MSEMIERVARALEAKLSSRTQRSGSQLREVFIPAGMYDLQDVARAAIEAMMEPTEDMTAAGWIDKEDVSPREIWLAMIAEALK